jgi:hypothetical protein
MKLQLRQSNRSNAKIRMAISGPSGSGKTYSSLLCAKGLTDNWENIAVIDSENGSADLYSDLGAYQVLTLTAPLSPEKYIQAIEVCEQAGIEVIILDSISHAWEYLLEIHSNMTGNSFTNWGKITPRQNLMIQRILNSPAHIIATMRTKQDYVLNLKNGKHVPEKVGLKTIQRDGVDYEFTIVLDMDINHNAKVSKDRTGLFSADHSLNITQEIGAKIKAWCESGVSEEEFTQMINSCQSNEELLKLYDGFPLQKKKFQQSFQARKIELLAASKNINSQHFNLDRKEATNGKI